VNLDSDLFVSESQPRGAELRQAMPPRDLPAARTFFRRPPAIRCFQGPHHASVPGRRRTDDKIDDAGAAFVDPDEEAAGRQHKPKLEIFPPPVRRFFQPVFPPSSTPHSRLVDGEPFAFFFLF